MQSLLKGFGKLLVNKEKVVNELSDNWAVVAEAIPNDSSSRAISQSL
jgi:hypothetical protein